MIHSHRHLGQARSFDDAPCQLWMRIAYAEARRSQKKYSFTEPDDLRSAALYGLAKAMKEYDGKQSKPLSFAITCMRYAIIEHVRQMDYLPRSLRDQLNRSGEIPLHCEKPISLELATHTGADGEEALVSDTLLGSEPDPLAVAARTDEASRLWALVAQLPEREATVIALHFSEEMTLKEIGKRLGVSESRTHQLRTKAFQRLREWLNQTEVTQ